MTDHAFSALIDRRNLLALLGGSAATLATASLAGADPDFPNKPIRIIVPYAPGGSTDVVARLVSEEMTKVLNVSVIVENRPGANGFIGATAAGTARPDGYTLVMLPPVLSLTIPVLKPDVPYADKLVPIVLVQSNEQILVTYPNFPASNLPELIALARQRPGTIAFGHTGVGSGNHMLAALLRNIVGLDITLATYRGELPALNDVMGEHIQLAVTSIAAGRALIDARSLKPLATLGGERGRTYPDLPTVSEAGVGEFDGNSFLGLHAPVGTPHAVMAKIAEATNKALEVPRVRERLETLGAEPRGGTPDDYREFLASHRKRVEGIIQRANIVYE